MKTGLSAVEITISTSDSFISTGHFILSNNIHRSALRQCKSHLVLTCSCVVIVPNLAANFSISGNFAGSIKFNRAQSSPVDTWNSVRGVVCCGVIAMGFGEIKGR